MIFLLIIAITIINVTIIIIFVITIIFIIIIVAFIVDVVAVVVDTIIITINAVGITAISIATVMIIFLRVVVAVVVVLPLFLLLASVSRAEDQASIPAVDMGIFPVRVILGTVISDKLVLQWLPCQAPGDIGSELELVCPVSVYCDWVR